MARNNSVSSSTALLNHRMSGSSNSFSDQESVNECSIRTGSTQTHSSLPFQHEKPHRQRLLQEQPRPCGVLEETSSPEDEMNGRPLPNPPRKNSLGSSSLSLNGQRPAQSPVTSSQVTLAASPQSARPQRVPEPDIEAVDVAAASGDTENGRNDRRRKNTYYPSHKFEGSILGRLTNKVEALYGRMRARPEPRGPSDGHHFCHLAVSLIAFMLSLAAVSFLIVLIYSGSIKLGGDDEKDNLPLCAPCSAIGDLHHAFRKQGSGESKQCCADTPSQRAKLHQFSVNKLFNPKKSEVPGREAQALTGRANNMPFAHIPLGLVSGNQFRGLYSFKLEPDLEHNSQDGRRYTGVSVTQIGIEIKTPGTYYVYSSVYFESDNGKCTRNKNVNYHFVQLMEPGGSDGQELLQSMFTCVPGTTSESQSRYVGGTFCLKKGRTVIASVTDQELVRGEDKRSSYLGLFMIRNEC